MNIQSVFVNSWRLFQKEGVGGLTSRLVCRVKVRFNEYRYGVSTEGLVTSTELGFKDTEYHRYSPTDYHHFSKVLGDLDIRADRDSFLDYGAGRGRAMIIAAGFPFKRVLGVEISSELAATARENFAQALARLRCKEIEVTTEDATLFKVPTDVTVIFFFNPFHGTVLARVLDNLRASLHERPRLLTVICSLPPVESVDSHFENQINACSWLKLSSKFAFGPESRWLIFNNSEDLPVPDGKK